jgi:hypothetical protein
MSGLNDVELTQADRENLDRQLALGRVDLTEHNADSRPPEFGTVVSQTPSAQQFEHPDFLRWESLLGFDHWADGFHRKVWEWAYILQAGRQYGVLSGGRRAVGFGVGNEPLPAVFARHDMSVIATDLTDIDEAESVQRWAETGQRLRGIEGLLRPDIVADERAMELIETRSVDMNRIPELPPCDLIWSAGSLEHLGSPERGIEFVRRTADLLAPGGIAVHTTEMDLVPHEQSIDYGELVCYQPADLRRLASVLRDDGYEVDLNLHVAMETPADRWVSVVLLHGFDLAAGESAHLKVALGESVLTSMGIIVARPGDEPDRPVA